MKIIDTNTVNYIFNNSIKIEGVYYLAPDVKEESELVEQIFGRKLPDGIKDISNETVFDECAYVRNYNEMLNKYAGRSFYNMTGFGDISTLALLKTLKETFQNRPRRLFRYMEESLVLITNDNPLKNKIDKEFNEKETDSLWKVTVEDNSHIT